MATDFLKITDLEPGKLYRVKFEGDDHDPLFRGCVVMGIAEHLGFWAVTVWLDPAACGDHAEDTRGWIGSRWGDRDDLGVDSDAQFELLPDENFVTLVMTRRMEGHQV